MNAETLKSRLAAEVPDGSIEAAGDTDQPTLVVPADRLLAVMRALCTAPDLAYTYLADLTVVDWWPQDPRFEVVYHLASCEHARRLRLRVRVPGGTPHVPSLTGLWPAADWLEREAWDLFGVVFDGHLDLRRLLMPDDWEGHPLRKDYPVQVNLPVRVGEPLQVSEAEFKANIEADRRARLGE